MKVTFLLAPVGYAGGNFVVAKHASWLAEHGHDVTLVSPPAPRPGFKKSVKSWLKGQGWPQWSRIVPSDFDNLGIKHIVLDAYRPPLASDVPVSDVVVATWWETAEWLMQLPESHGAKAYFIQGHEIFDHLPVERSAATYRLPIYKIVVSQWLKNIMKSQYGLIDCDVVPNAVDRALFAPSAKGRKKSNSVGFLYHKASLKGADIALEVVCKLIKKHPDVKIYAFGRPEKIEADIAEVIIYKSSPEKNEIKEIYNSCDVWLSTSRTEGFNLTAMEAMACGTPVISTMTGWPVEAVKNGINGYLCSIDDGADIYQKLSHLMEMDSDDWFEMSKNAVNTVNNSDWASSSLLFESALLRAIESRHS